MPSHNAWNPSCETSPSQSIRFAVCLRRNSSGMRTSSRSAGTRTFRSAATVASFFVHSDSIESFDQSTTTLLADSSSRSMV